MRSRDLLSLLKCLCSAVYVDAEDSELVCLCGQVFNVGAICPDQSFTSQELSTLKLEGSPST